MTPSLEQQIAHFERSLESIQWITHNQQFNQKQHIQLGDAIVSFYDCIELLKKSITVLEMVEDNRKMPHKHADFQVRLHCLAERAREVLDKRRES